MQFTFLASQNTMAALIGGQTVHAWGAIPVNATEAASKIHVKTQDGDVDALFLNALGMRWIFLDECTTVSPGLLGVLDSYLRRACSRHPYAKRARAQRPFGGINIVFCGDLWQLTPVRACSFFSNPFKTGYSLEEQKMFKMFWCKGEDSIQRTFELTQSLRTGDAWLKNVLAADRHGVESWEMYCFIHGLPTRNPGSWSPTDGVVTCGNARCRNLASDKWPKMWERHLGGENWDYRRNLECAVCATERQRRCCIISTQDGAVSRYTEAAFMTTRQHTHHKSRDRRHCHARNSHQQHGRNQIIVIVVAMGRRHPQRHRPTCHHHCSCHLHHTCHHHHRRT